MLGYFSLDKVLHLNDPYSHVIGASDKDLINAMIFDNLGYLNDSPMCQLSLTPRKTFLNI